MKLTDLEKLERQKAIIRSQRDVSIVKPKAQLFGVRVKKWNEPSKLCSLCQACIDSIEPPTRRIIEGESGTGNCDWCEVRNII